MSENNVYSSPKSNLEPLASEEAVDINDYHFFTFKGRMGRMRYFTYTLIFLFISIPVVFLGFILAETLSIPSSVGIGAAVLWGIVYFVFAISLYIRRLHDIGMNGLWWLVTLIPYIGGIFAFVLLFIPGHPTENTYGKRPPENTKSIKVTFWCSLIFCLIVPILAAVSIPAYQDYQNKAAEIELDYEY